MSDWQNCCRGRRSNCPHVKVNGRVVQIKDDDDNIVTMTLDQLQDVHLKVNEIVMQRATSRQANLEPAPLGLVP